MSYKEIEGDLIELALEGKFDVITHGCNCFCKQKSGVALHMVKAFGTNQFRLEHPKHEGDIYKLGNIDYEVLWQEKVEYGGKWDKYPVELEFITGKKMTVINSYTQFKYGRPTNGVTHLDYEALTLCLRKINHTYPNMTIGLPYVIGCGLAGGDKVKVIEIIKRELVDMDIIMVKKL